LAIIRCGFYTIYQEVPYYYYLYVLIDYVIYTPYYMCGCCKFSSYPTGSTIHLRSVARNTDH
jgi:hypothetical protein